MICGNSWGTTERGWLWCVLERGHAGSCVDGLGKPKPDTEKFFHEQPEALAEIQKQTERERLQISRKVTHENQDS